MSGHSKWAKIKRQKGANDAKKGQEFTKLGHAIAVAAKNGGGDPDMNPNLALAVEKAKSANMPHANIERSIKRGTGELGGEQITELMFEAYGPHGAGIIVETASDNRNRITTDVRTAITKHGGSMAEAGSVTFQFDRKGVLRVPTGADKDQTILTILDCGAEDVLEVDNELIVYTAPKDLHLVHENLNNSGVTILEADLQFVPKTLVKIEDKSSVEKIITIMEALEEIDGVVNTFSNFDIDDNLLV